MTTKVTNGLDLSNQRVINLGSPSGGTDAATKDYVDNVARGLDWKASVRAASTGNIDLAVPGTTIDGVTMATGDRFLAKDQTAGAENGIYVWNGAAVAATRATDADSDAEVTAGLATSVTEGTVNGDQVWLLTTNNPIALDTDALVFSQLGGGSSYAAGNGLTESPAGTFNVGAGTGISVSADSVSVDTNVVMRRFAANVGDGAATQVTISHNFGTRDVAVEVFTNAAPHDSVLCDVDRPDVNSVRLGFATAPSAGAYRVVVIG